MAVDLEQLFAPEVARHNIIITDREPIKLASHVYIAPWGTMLKIRHDIYDAERVEAAAVQVGRIVLGHHFQRSGWRDERANRREWRQALEWAARRLVPWRMLSRASAYDWTTWELAEEAGVTERLAILAGEAWLRERGQVVRFRPRIQAPAVVETQDPLFL